MSHRTERILAAIGIIGVFATLMGGLYTWLLLPPETPQWKRMTIYVSCGVVCMVFLILLLYLLHSSEAFANYRSRRRYKRCFLAGHVYYANEFPDYCNACAAMVRRASSHGVITIQTPIQYHLSLENQKAFEEYLAATFSVIVPQDTPYQRLVVIDPSVSMSRPEDDPAEKAISFVTSLIDAVKAATSDNPPSLVNVQIAFVIPTAIPHRIYGNLDIHLTSDTDFAIAILGDKKPDWFGGSVHMRDTNRVLSDDLRKTLDMAWDWAIRHDTVVVIPDLHDIDPANKKRTRKSIAEIDAIMASLHTRIVAINTKLRIMAMGCALIGVDCPITGGISAIPAFVKELDIHQSPDVKKALAVALN